MAFDTEINLSASWTQQTEDASLTSKGAMQRESTVQPGNAKGQLCCIQVWFALDLLLALLPLLHWQFGVSNQVLGYPPTLAYFWGTSPFIAASVVVAYFADPALCVEL